MKAGIAGALAVLACLAALAGCGDGDSTTVINQTTTVTGDESTTTESSSTTTGSTTTDDDGDGSDDDGSDDGPVLSLKAFQSPTGNIACVMTGKYVRCDIAERDWSPPPAPADCPVDYGQGIQLPANGSAEFVCAGDTVLKPQAEELPYGSSSHVGLITCESEDSGIECENESGGDFKLSREEYDLN
jgi:hypothetical protein